MRYSYVRLQTQSVPFLGEWPIWVHYWASDAGPNSRSYLSYKHFTHWHNCAVLWRMTHWVQSWLSLSHTHTHARTHARTHTHTHSDGTPVQPNHIAKVTQKSFVHYSWLLLVCGLKVFNCETFVNAWMPMLLIFQRSLLIRWPGQMVQLCCEPHFFFKYTTLKI